MITIIYFIVCDALSKPANGNVSSNGSLYDTATYFCDDGYELIGDSKIMCQSNGMWSGSPPVCQG